MRKQLSLSLLALGMVLPCSAGDIGLGASMTNSNSSAIYVPVRVSPALMLEGKVSYQHECDVYNSTYTTLDGKSIAYSYKNSNSTLSAGVGLFWLRPMTESSHLYLGPRIGFAQNKSSYSDSGNLYKSNAIFVAPTIGFEYFPIKSVSLGGEMGVGYSKSHHSSQNGMSYLDHTEQEGTFTSLILRYYF